ncbi:MAG: NAD(P)/FAD-dependent oxidoreductase [Bacteroidota bacterium]
MQERVLIVGGGLSGICLAHQLDDRNIDFLMIDGGQNESSSIAAGMINPMVFRKMTKTWRGDDLIPYLEHFYPAIESKVNQRFFFTRKLRRVFATNDEKNYWETRNEDPAFRKYVSPVNPPDKTPEYVKSTFGNGFVKSPGYIDAPLFMKSNHRYFSERNQLRYENFDFFHFNADKKTYKGQSFSHVIFSEGFRGKYNPFFGYLPLQQTKGEVLSISSDQLKKDEILNRKCFVLPLEQGGFKLGATFAWETTDTSPTRAAREELLDKYHQLADAAIAVTGQEAGIRPTVTDRRPLIGEHPSRENLFIFNGMGTKGYMIAPYFSNQLSQHLFDGRELDEDVDIQRFYKKHFPKD